MLRLPRSIPVVMFHGVAPDRPDRPPQMDHWLEPAVFERYCQVLRRQRFETLFLHELRDIQRRRRPMPDRAVVLTFDDGYLDFWLYAFPLLRKYEINATAFVTTDFIDDEPARRLPEAFPYGFLSWDELREMEASGLVDVQSHAVTHTWYPTGPRLLDMHRPGLPWKAFRHLWWNRYPERKPKWCSEARHADLPWGVPVSSTRDRSWRAASISIRRSKRRWWRSLRHLAAPPSSRRPHGGSDMRRTTPRRSPGVPERRGSTRPTKLGARGSWENWPTAGGSSAGASTRRFGTSVPRAVRSTPRSMRLLCRLATTRSRCRPGTGAPATRPAPTRAGSPASRRRRCSRACDRKVWMRCPSAFAWGRSSGLSPIEQPWFYFAVCDGLGWSDQVALCPSTADVTRSRARLCAVPA